ncbi:Msh2 [Symbiodinium natans]|uniref:Msh2 protein n=1 Tax=Symbiodinium natans TaxID=878477 RepID=A0A812RBB0_9DINO|nr:Msh2 [Symbiodinium natans]
MAEGYFSTMELLARRTDRDVKSQQARQVDLEQDLLRLLAGTEQCGLGRHLEEQRKKQGMRALAVLIGHHQILNEPANFNSCTLGLYPLRSFMFLDKAAFSALNVLPRPEESQSKFAPSRDVTWLENFTMMMRALLAILSVLAEGLREARLESNHSAVPSCETWSKKSKAYKAEHDDPCESYLSTLKCCHGKCIFKQQNCPIVSAWGFFDDSPLSCSSCDKEMPADKMELAQSLCESIHLCGHPEAPCKYYPKKKTCARKRLSCASCNTYYPISEKRDACEDFSLCYTRGNARMSNARCEFDEGQCVDGVGTKGYP